MNKLGVENDAETIERIVLTQLLHLNATILGLITGLVVGIGVFAVTFALVLKGGPVVGPHLALLNQVLLGYRVTFTGSLIGFLYGFVGGFAVGYSVARLYNWIADLRQAIRRNHS